LVSTFYTLLWLVNQAFVLTYQYCIGFFSSDVFIEKHWKSVISRSVCDYFFDQHRKAINPEDIPPVIATPHHYLISIYRSGLYFVAVCMTEG